MGSPISNSGTFPSSNGGTSPSGLSDFDGDLTPTGQDSEQKEEPRLECATCFGSPTDEPQAGCEDHDFHNAETDTAPPTDDAPAAGRCGRQPTEDAPACQGATRK